MESEILQKCHVARLHGRDDALGFRTVAILRKSDGPAAERSAERLDQKLQREGGIGLAIGAAEMREHDHLGAFLAELFERGYRALDPGGVRDASVFQGHVEVDAHEHAFALRSEIVEGAEVWHGRDTAKRLRGRSDVCLKLGSNCPRVGATRSLGWLRRRSEGPT